MSTPGSQDPPSPNGGVAPPAPGFEPVRVEDSAAAGEPELVDAADAIESVPEPPAPPPKRPAAAAPTLAEITDQDREFIQRVFLQVRDVDFRAPPPPPPRRDLAGPDKKIAALRQTVHELERDLSRVGYVWSAMQQQYEAVDQLITAKEAERQSAVARYNQLKDLAAQAAQRDRAEIDSLKRRLAEVEGQRAGLENDLANTQAQAAARAQKADQEKTALIADFRSKMESAQQAFKQLRDQSTRALGDLEARLKAREEELVARGRELEGVHATVADRDRELEAMRSTVSRHEQTIAQLQGEREKQEAALAERSRGLNNLAEEVARTREHHESALSDLRASIKGKDELIEATRGEVRSARAEFNQLAEQHKASRIELEQATVELTNVRAELERVRGELASRDQSLDSAQAALASAREDARLARADADALGQQLSGLQK